MKTKWECMACGFVREILMKPCIEESDKKPTGCVYGMRIATNWHPVEEEKG